MKTFFKKWKNLIQIIRHTTVYVSAFNIQNIPEAWIVRSMSIFAMAWGILRVCIELFPTFEVLNGPLLLHNTVIAPYTCEHERILKSKTMRNFDQTRRNFLRAYKKLEPISAEGDEIAITFFPNI